MFLMNSVTRVLSRSNNNSQQRLSDSKKPAPSTIKNSSGGKPPEDDKKSGHLKAIVDCTLQGTMASTFLVGFCHPLDVAKTSLQSGTCKWKFAEKVVKKPSLLYSGALRGLMGRIPYFSCAYGLNIIGGHVSDSLGVKEENKKVFSAVFTGAGVALPLNLLEGPKVIKQAKDAGNYCESPMTIWRRNRGAVPTMLREVPFMLGFFLGKDFVQNHTGLDDLSSSVTAGATVGFLTNWADKAKTKALTSSKPMRDVLVGVAKTPFEGAFPRAKFIAWAIPVLGLGEKIYVLHARPHISYLNS